MSDPSGQASLPSLQLLPLQYHEFHSLPAGFEYQHELSEAESNTSVFDEEVGARDLYRCVVCGMNEGFGPRPKVQQAHIIGTTQELLWADLKATGFVPSVAKSVAHESRNSISLCIEHHIDFVHNYRFFIRWVPLFHAFIFINFSMDKNLEEFHGKIVALDPNHDRSPFPAPFLIQEMRTRGFNPWCTDQPVPYPLSSTYTPNNSGNDTTVDFSGSSSMAKSAGAASFSSSPGSPPTGINQQYLILSNPFQDSELLESMRHQWQQLPNWKSATVEGLTWEGTAEENARKYINAVGVSTP